MTMAPVPPRFALAPTPYDNQPGTDVGIESRMELDLGPLPSAPQQGTQGGESYAPSEEGTGMDLDRVETSPPLALNSLFNDG